jgi:hypothetical protein
VIAALGITWILDGLEVTLVGALGGVVAQDPAVAPPLSLAPDGG